MKICYIGSNAPRLFNLMKDMRDRGHEIHWISISVPKFIIPGVTIHKEIDIFGKNVFKLFILTPYYIFKVREIMKKISPDIVHAINVEWAGWISILSGHKNVYVTTQGSDVMIRENMKNDLVHRWLRKKTLTNAKVVTYGNDAMLNDILTWASPRETLKYFAGINFDIFNYNKENDFKEKYGVQNKKVVFSPRTFAENSNIDILIETIPTVKKCIPNVIYAFAYHAGNNSYALKIKKLIKKLHVEDSCIFLEKVLPEEMSGYYTLSDVVVSIPSSDGMPATLLESMAMKRTLVITQIPSYTNIMSEKYAFVVGVRSVDETADAILNALREEKETIRLRENGYKWVINNADYRKLNDMLESKYYQTIE